MATTLDGELERLGVSVPRSAREKLEIYVRELEHWTKAVNLTALRGVDLVRRLVAEPAWIGAQLHMSGNLLDLGSGNGCPGIPLFVTCPLDRVDLVEARARRAAFLRHIGSLLGPNGIVVHRIRLEDMQYGPKGTDWISLQAVDPAPKLIQVLQRLFSPTTRVVWITSRGTPPVRDASLVSVPGSNTVAWVSKLDQF